MLRNFRNRPQKHLNDMDLLMYSADIQNLTEIVKNRLYFAVVSPQVKLKSKDNTYFFNTDEEFLYMSYYYDFGPLNISCLYKYCCKLHEYLHTTNYKRIVHYTTTDPQNKANAAFLIGSFAVIFLHIIPREITRALVSGCTHFMPFADASQGGSEWKINLIECYSAIHKAYTLGFFNFNDFDYDEYDTYDQLQNGDLNWLIPRKFLAFIGPTDLEILNYHPPEFYIQYFKKNDVKAVIRLNNSTYNPTVFSSVGIGHYDLFFPDGSTPPKHILLEFLKIVETTPGAIAVHCKAGLGRTGSLIAAYIVKHYRFTAREAIAWLRICRPGSVIGQQQGWLEHMENWLWRQGNCYRFEHFGNCDRIPHHKFGIYSNHWTTERSKLLRICKQKDVQYSSFTGSSSILHKNYSKPTVRLEYGKFTYPNKPSSTRVLNNYEVVRIREPHFIPVENISQGDKLNVIKANKQQLSIGSSSSYTTSTRLPSTKTKNQFGFTLKKSSVDTCTKKK